jgi:uncharacterized protein
MPELLTPGVFIQEVEFGPQPIEGVSTSTAGFVGETERGPSEGPPVLVTSQADFARKFGGFVAGKILPISVRGFFENGGKRAYIARVVSETAEPAAATLYAGYHAALLATQPATLTTDPQPITLRVASVVGATPTNSVEIIRKADFTVVGAGTIDFANAATGIITVTLTADLTEDATPTSHAIQYAVGTVGTDPPTTPRIAFAARDAGGFSNRVKVLMTPVYIATAPLTGVAGTTEFNVNPVSIFSIGETVEFDKADGSAREYVTIEDVDPALNKITVDPAITGTFVAGEDFVRSVGWRVEVFFDGNLVETIDQISSDNAAPDGIVERLKSSQWIRVSSLTTLNIEAADAADAGSGFALFPKGEPIALGVVSVPGGAATLGTEGGAITSDDVIGSDSPPRTGLKALEAQDGINIIAAPGLAKQRFDALDTDGAILIVGELIAQAERKMDRFAVFESNDEDDIGQVLQFRNKFNSRFGAEYHPWLRVRDPATDLIIPLPPSGHVMGAYARTDNERGVFKAPANVVVRGISGFTHDIPDGEQDILNPAGVNVLRRFDGLGNVIWGARTISSETLWRYVPVRRLFIFIEQSLVRGTRFAVFEPNDLKLWARLRDGVTNFLTTQWRAGALFGAKPEEAFFVKVDETTTTEEDRQLGRVNIIVGIAPVRPAEFIIFQIGQAPQSVIIAEQG